MALNDILIKSYRGLEDLHLNDIEQISLIVGANNSGKSSILEAAAVLMRPYDPAQWVQLARQRDADADLADALWSIFRSKGVLKLDDGPQQSKLTEISGKLFGEVRVMKAKCVASEGWDAGESGDATIRISVKVNDLPTHELTFRRDAQALWGDGVKHHRCFSVTPVTHRSGRSLVDFLSRVVDEGGKGIALEMLQLFDPDVQSLDVSAGQRRQTVVVNHRKRGVVDLASFGDGMRRVVAIALALTRAHNGVLLIDEIESAIHPKALNQITEKLLLAAIENNVQIIATTHSLEAIDALINATNTLGDEISTKVAAYYLALSDSGQTVRRYDHAKLESLREAGVDLR